ncbi:MAG: hypothetical protein K2M31_03375 [Muribaculaceae bacterium]|nr:hypothetical protein [Muribaculaceae bacterium]
MSKSVQTIVLLLTILLSGGLSESFAADYNDSLKHKLQFIRGHQSQIKELLNVTDQDLGKKFESAFNEYFTDEYQDDDVEIPDSIEHFIVQTYEAITIENGDITAVNDSIFDMAIQNIDQHTPLDNEKHKAYPNLYNDLKYKLDNLESEFMTLQWWVDVLYIIFVAFSIFLIIYLISRLRRLKNYCKNLEQYIDQLRASSDRRFYELTESIQTKSPSYAKAPTITLTQSPTPESTMPAESKSERSSRVRTDTTGQSDYVTEFASLGKNSQYGEFDKISAEPSQEKIYVITSIRGSNIGDFSINPHISSEFRKEIVQNRNLYLPSNFVSIQAINPTPTSFKEVKRGKVKKEDGKWKVTDRLVIDLT